MFRAFTASPRRHRTPYSGILNDSNKRPVTADSPKLFMPLSPENGCSFGHQLQFTPLVLK
jgi:hypothetical protein